MWVVSFRIVGQVSSFPTLPAAALPGAQTSHTQHLTCVPSSQFPARTTTMYSSAKSPVVLPPPPYRPMLVPRTTALPPGVRLDAVPVTVSVPHVHTYPYMAPSSISPTHLPPPPPSSLQDSNALDLSAPTRKRKSEGSNSSGSEEDLPFPTSHSSSKLYRDNSGSPLELLPQSRSPHHLPSSTAALSPHHKPDINGNVTGGGSTADASDFVESTTEADISSWDTESVVGFINTIPGCQEYSEVRPEISSNFKKNTSKCLRSLVLARRIYKEAVSSFSIRDGSFLAPYVDHAVYNLVCVLLRRCLGSTG